MRHPVRIAWLALAALAPWVGGALASTADSVEWDGFARWIRAMQSDRLTVEAPPALDLSRVPPGAGLALLDPPAAEFDGLRLFVQEGGRVLLAVEGPAAEPLLEAFDIQLAPVPPRSPLDEGHPALRGLPAPGSGLFAGVDDLLANRPAAIAAPVHLEPAVRFGDGAAFAYHLQLGEGELLVLADASLFINLMLDGADNARLARNAAAWMSRGGAVPIWFAGPATPIEGRYGDAASDTALAGLNRALSDLGRILDPDDLVLHLLLAMAIAGTLVFAVSVFPGGASSVTEGPVIGAPGRAEHLAGRPTGPAGPEAAPAAERPPDPATPPTRDT